MSFATQHVDMIHDAQMDYYSKRLATCSSDTLIKIFAVPSQALLATLKGHEAPVWQICWAHPSFGSILASCSYDSKVFIWKEVDNVWTRIKIHPLHSASVNSISWASHEYGLVLVCASSDGRVSILTYKEDGSWDVNTVTAHSIGVNSVSWAPANVPGSVITSGAEGLGPKRFASGGCDNLVKIWREEDGNWKEEHVLKAHTDWVRDVAFSPNVGMKRSYLASCSQDKTVIIWTSDNGGPWNKKLLTVEPFPDVIWRVSWSIGGNLLAVSCGDNKVSLWKESLAGDWISIGDVGEQGTQLTK